MARDLEQKNLETLVFDLVQGTLDVNELNLAKAKQRDAFLQALEKRPALLTKVSSSNEAHFFKFAIEKNYEYFVQLKRSQYTDELAQIYIFNRLTTPNVNNKKPTETRSNTDIIVQKSLDSKTIFNFLYLTPEGEELYYFDKELQVPLALKSSFQLTLKLSDAVALIDRLDTHITQLGEQKIKTVITDLITTYCKGYLNEFIQEKKIGYYALCTSLGELESMMKKKLAGVFKAYGIEVTDFIVKKVAIPKDIQNKLEDQAFRIRQRRAEVEADAEFAMRSLESYEAKLAVQQKYPDAEVGLTEYEKDLALKRFLTKKGVSHEEQVDRTIKMTQKTMQRDSDVKKAEDIVPDIPQKKNKFAISYFLLLAISVIIALIAGEEEPGVTLILLGIITLIFGAVAAFNTKKFSSAKVEASLPTETAAEEKTETEE